MDYRTRPPPATHWEPQEPSPWYHTNLGKIRLLPAKSTAGALYCCCCLATIKAKTNSDILENVNESQDDDAPNMTLSPGRQKMPRPLTTYA
ncbi:hypothetical protein E2C01_076937 [Portunus trituberculatus]|uniref:Uncharacterized protein n=1 Tax=Portunus trituberculatus TaxID=210409 RepID=A0A5B7ID26_PORTR|nr:hypothetical protein [Portunus trituberculatus]